MATLEDYYTREGLDFRTVKGDTLFINLSFTSSNGIPLDITAMGMRFTIRDPITDAILIMASPITTHSKEHLQGVTIGSGISYFNDTDLVAKGLSMDSSDQVIITLESVDTSLFRLLPHVWELELSSDNFQRKTTIKGRIIVDRELG